MNSATRKVPGEPSALVDVCENLLESRDSLRKAIRRGSLPADLRGQVWRALVERLIDDKYDVSELIARAYSKPHVDIGH